MSKETVIIVGGGWKEAGEGRKGGSISVTDRFQELFSRRDPEFLSAFGMSIDWN